MKLPRSYEVFSVATSEWPASRFTRSDGRDLDPPPHWHTSAGTQPINQPIWANSAKQIGTHHLRKTKFFLFFLAVVPTCIRFICLSWAIYTSIAAASFIWNMELRSLLTGAFVAGLVIATPSVARSRPDLHLPSQMKQAIINRQWRCWLVLRLIEPSKLHVAARPQRRSMPATWMEIIKILVK